LLLVFIMIIVEAFHPPPDWQYDVANTTVKGVLNVHVVSHTHDDTGWLRTVDEYYNTQVRFILDSVVDALQKNPFRRFTYVEMAFFARWWEEQSEARKDVVRDLVSNKQLVFTNGGWCMHDEAAPLFNEMIDQTTRGHQFILKEFGEEAAPRATWQVDPFGHSGTQAWLLSAEAGMPALFWARMDEDDRQARRATKQLEYIWRGSHSMGKRADTFSGFLWGDQGYGLYTCPVNFEGYPAGLQDNPARHGYNVDEFVNHVVFMAKKQGAEYKTQHIQWTCGADFNYKNADTWFHNLDVLMHYVNQDGRVRMLYSTPTDYADAKNKDQTVTWSVRKDDLFPYREGEHVFWSGYFSSRVALKRLVRFSTNLLNSARQLEFMTRGLLSIVTDENTAHAPVVGSGWTDSFEGAVAVAMHHDGISGTAKQAVTNDYAQRISEGQRVIEEGISKSISYLFKLDNAKWTYCHALNISICELTSMPNTSFSVAAWNPRAQARKSFTFRIPVSLGSDSLASRARDPQKLFQITSAHTHSQTHGIATQLVKLDERTLELPLFYLNSYGLSRRESMSARGALQNNATHVLVFQADLPATGGAIFNVQRILKEDQIFPSEEPIASNAKVEGSFTADAIQNDYQNDKVRVSFDTKSGAITAITDLESGFTCNFEIEWGWYESSPGGCSEFGCSAQASGAYVFRPNSTAFHFPGPDQRLKTSVEEGPVTIEIHQEVSSWVSHVIRLEKGKGSVEIEYTVGPIPLHNDWLPNHSPWGKEVAVRYRTCINSGETFHTDSNGLEMMPRVRNQRPKDHAQTYKWLEEPIAANYYPVNAMISIVDKSNSRRLSVVTDSTQGGTSLESGVVELMVHRRTLFDDKKGVAEPLNETMCGCNGANEFSCLCEGLVIRGKHQIVLGNIAAVREMNALQQFRPVTFFAPGQVATKAKLTSMIKGELPSNVHLLTVSSNYGETKNDDQGESTTLVRLQHTFAKNEDEELSKPVTISLKDLFVMPYASAEEVSLTANMAVEKKYTYKWKTDEDSDNAIQEYIESRLDKETGKVTLQAMEIRTFLVRFKSPFSETRKDRLGVPLEKA